MRILLSVLTVIMVAIMSTSPLQAEELAPHLYKTVLDNGLTVIVKEMGRSPAVMELTLGVRRRRLGPRMEGGRCATSQVV